MPNRSYLRRAQIPISKDRLQYLMFEYRPDPNSEWIRKKCQVLEKDDKTVYNSLRVPDTRRTEKLQVCDTSLAEKLTKIAKSDHRSIRMLEQGDFIPNARYYSEPVTVAGRDEWHKKALDSLKGVDIVFVDPDNGMLVKSVGKRSVKSVKYTFYEEVADYIGQKQSVLIYNHRSRKKENVYFQELCEKLGKITGVPESRILKITFPRCSIRDYLAVPASDEHYEKIRAAFLDMEQGIWGQNEACRIPN